MTQPLDRLVAALADRYRLERELGAGGMATVYLAEDVRHDRRVAVKVLRPELAAVIGAERFLAEIKTTANLQHPHILPLFDSGAADGFLFYVMPYVAGESLRDRLSREKQLPVTDAVRIASEIAGALDYAHRQGIIHRDIKPENVLLHDGRALVADFGIALAASKAGGSRMTETGMSLGTPQYMSPEQAMGEREITARSDVYALGALTYEMLTGEPPFTGPTAQAIVAKVMTETPGSIQRFRARVPAAVEDAVLTALEKLPADRFGTAAEFAAALATGVPGRRTAPARGRGTRRSALLIPAVALLALAAGVLLSRLPGQRHTRGRATRRAVIPLSPEFDVRGSDVAVSADGSTLVVTDGGRIMVRRLDRLDLTQLPGSEDGAIAFVAADGSRIGYIRAGQAVVQGVDGSDPVTVAGAPVAEASFLDEAHLITVDTAGLAVVDIRTGARTVAAVHPPGMIFLQPQAMPGGRGLVATRVAGDIGTARIVAVDLASRRMDTLPLGPALGPRYSDGLLYFARPNGVLQAVPFDAEHLRVLGPPEPVGDVAVVGRVGRVPYGVGAGLLAYGGRGRNRLVAFGDDGRRTVLSPVWGNFHNPRASPDGTRVLADREEGDVSGRDVWILDLATGSLSRATSVGDAHDAVWTPDGTRVTYLSFSTAGGPIVTASAQGAAGVAKIAVSNTVNPGVWLADGSTYVAGLVVGPGNSDIVAFHTDGRAADTLVATRFDEHSPAVSFDGHWLAYTSNETGANQVYVRALRGGSGRTLVSDGSGEEPAWGRDGRLFYVEHHGSKSRLRAVRLGAGDPPAVRDRSVVLEELVYQPVSNHTNWDVMPDGRKLFVEPGTGTELVLVFDWAPRGGRTAASR